MLLKVNTDGSRVRLRDVARLGLGAESYSVHNNEYNGDPATGLAVKLATGANATLESIAAVTSERGFSLPTPPSPYLTLCMKHSTSTRRLNALFFEYALASAEAGRLWTSGQDNGDFPARKRESMPQAECPADDSFLQRFAALAH